MNGLIILEGPDGSGKSTLANQIQEAMGGTIFHSPASANGSWQSEWDHFGKHERADKGLVIADRYPIISEMVYGYYRKEYRTKDLMHSFLYKNWHHFTKVVIVFCLPTSLYLGDEPHTDARGLKIGRSTAYHMKNTYGFLQDIARNEVDFIPTIMTYNWQTVTWTGIEPTEVIINLLKKEFEEWLI